MRCSHRASSRCSAAVMASKRSWDCAEGLGGAVVPAPQVDPSKKGITGSDSAADRSWNHTLPTESIAQIKTDGLPRTTRPGAGESEVHWILARNLCGEKKYVDGGAGTANCRCAVAAADWESVGGAWPSRSDGSATDAGRGAREAASAGGEDAARRKARAKERTALIPAVTPVAAARSPAT